MEKTNLTKEEPKANSIQSRLNPKLTRLVSRPLPPPLSELPTEPEESISTLNEMSDITSIREIKAIQQTSKSDNPSLRVFHNGKWAPPEYSKMGRQIYDSGFWECCGNRDKCSLYCRVDHMLYPLSKYNYSESISSTTIQSEITSPILEGFAARDHFSKYFKLAMAKKQEEAQEEHHFKEHIRNVRMAALLESQSSGPKDSSDPALSPRSRPNLGPLTPEELLLRRTCSSDSAANAPMLVGWLNKNQSSEPIATRSLEFILQHLQSGESCVQLQKHKLSMVVLQIQRLWASHPPIQLLVVSVLRCLLECNLTREDLTQDTQIFRVVLAIGHTHMNSRPHVEQAVRSIAQCFRSEVCRDEGLATHTPGYLLHFAHRHFTSPSLLRQTLRALNWLATTPERLVLLYQIGSASLALKGMRKYRDNADVLSPAFMLLTRISGVHPSAMDYVIRKKAVADVIQALRVLFSHESLQIEGLKMIRTIATTSEGWKQISDFPGGWQALCQGTSIGDSLVHEVEGEFHNPGWAIGETPFPSLMERFQSQAAQAAKSKTRKPPKDAWTAHSLKKYMGITNKDSKLAENLDHDQMYYEMLVSLNLLPRPGEEKEYWYMRLSAFEKENSIKLDDMMDTLKLLKKKDSREAREALLAEHSSQPPKPTYMRGQIVTGAQLAANDMSLKERMALSGVDGLN